MQFKNTIFFTLTFRMLFRGFLLSRQGNCFSTHLIPKTVIYIANCKYRRFELALDDFQFLQSARVP